MARLRLGGNLTDWRKRIDAGEAQLHGFGKGFAITEVRTYTHPTERVLNVLLLGGKEFDSWKGEADQRLVTFARENGASAIEFSCRNGLAKKVAELGYRKHRTLMRKELDEARDTRPSA